MPLPKIRVMHLLHQLNAGGMENGVVNIANHINREIFDLSICVFTKGGQLADKLDDRTQIFELEKRNGNDLSLPVKTWKLFREWQPDIIHTHAWGTLCEGLSAAMFASVPVKIHGEHGTIQNNKKQVLAQKIVWRFADQILSVSVEHKNRLSSTIGFPASRIKVIDNGVNTSLFSQKQRPIPIETIGLTKDNVVIGTVGRLVPVKNQEILIKAFSKVVKNNKSARLVFVGNGPLRNRLENLVEALGVKDYILFLGERPDIQKILRVFDIFVLPSLSEGMSNTILEAMSTALPVVATNVGDNHRLVDDNKTGYLVESDNIEQLTAAIEKLMNDPQKRKIFGQQGRKKMTENFSIQTMVKNYENLYQTLNHRINT